MTETHADGHRSLKILAELRRGRVTEWTSPRAGRTVGELLWTPAQSNSIQLDDYRTLWHAGHVSALISDGTVVIAGTQTGGVWVINPTVIPTYRNGHRGVPVSDDWDTPDVLCLAYGPDGTDQVFVGCSGAPSAVLLLMDVASALGGPALKQAVGIPVPTLGGIWAMLTLTDPRRIVLATTDGVWWSSVPFPASNVTGYSWQVAGGLPGGYYGGLARGPGGSVVAAGWGFDNGGGAHGLFRGVWQGGSLVFSPSQIAGVAIDQMRRTSVASCDDHRETMYAVAAGANEQISVVLASTDGGQSWHTVATPPNHGGQGNYNNCIAVSPYRPNVVALGWRRTGPFISVDSGGTWKEPPSHAALHSDLHALYFARNGLGADHLFVGSDGGGALTRDLGQTYDGQYSRPLGNLQFYGSTHTSVFGLSSVFGSFTASSRFPGLIAGGTQDNGNLYLFPDPDAGPSWFELEGGDGGLHLFVDALGAILRNSNGAPAVMMAFWDTTKKSFGAAQVIPVDGNAAGLVASTLGIVEQPSWRRGGQLMYACAGTEEGNIYGLFANPDGSGAKFSKVASVNGLVSALASADGSRILVGTATGRLLSVNSVSGVATDQSPPDDFGATGAVIRIELGTSHRAYALRSGTLMSFAGTVWTPLNASRPWASFAFDRESGRIFAATDTDVFVSTDLGATWTDASQRLPTRPHCSDLRIAADGRGGRDLYLATYGRSVWRATIALGPDDSKWDLPPLASQILFGVIQDGGGVIRVGGRLVKVPPRPPIRDLLAAVAIDELAQSMSKRNAKAIRQAAMRQIAQIARQLLKRLR